MKLPGKSIGETSNTEVKRRGLAYYHSERLEQSMIKLASTPVMNGESALGSVYRGMVTLPIPSVAVRHELVLVWNSRQGFLLADSSAGSPGTSSVFCL